MLNTSPNYTYMCFSMELRKLFLSTQRLHLPPAAPTRSGAVYVAVILEMTDTVTNNGELRKRKVGRECR